MRSSALRVGYGPPVGGVGGARLADRQRAGGIAAELGEDADDVLGRGAELQADGAQLRRFRQQVRRPRQEQLRWHAPRRQRHQQRQREGAARRQPLRRVGEARPLGVHLDDADDAAFVIDGELRHARRPRLSGRSSMRSGSSALSASLLADIKSKVRRPTAAATTSARPSWQLGLPASSSRMKRRPTPVAKARSSWRIFRASRCSRTRAPKLLSLRCGPSFQVQRRVGRPSDSPKFPIGNL